ncbi:D-alanine--D-alanine ligase [Candidatus Woesebacteria bacterium]|nr:D-alanine--D-alanine ligase [Candidatus Woesebacteria bacterium]
MKKLNVGVIMGGKSAEHEISVLSGREVLKNLDRKKYQAFPILIPKSGGLKLPKKKLDVVFIALHGPFGEDGTVQGLLEFQGITHTGSGILASSLGMDKQAFKRLLFSEKIKSPKYAALKKNKKELKEIVKKVGSPPYFVKPHNQGSSVGGSIVKKYKELSGALKFAFKYSDTVLVEDYIEGREITAAVIGNSKPRALPLVEIIPLKGDFFDYESKYTESGAKEITPAGINPQLTRKIQEIALRVYKLIGCRGFARVDFLIDKKGTPFVLEINTIPGLTPMSLFPKAAKAAGISYPKLLDQIIAYAFKNVD